MARTISLIVPTYNMADKLSDLWQSLQTAECTSTFLEILFVNDGSTDETKALLEQICTNASFPATIAAIHLPKNHGRFLARRIGAQAAKGDLVLFLDTRLTIANNFATTTQRLSREHDVLMGNVDIDTSKNLFCLYWDRTHRLIFRRHFKASEKPFFITRENYDSFLKGTGIFLCPKDLFLEACERFGTYDLLSDDTFLLKEIVKTKPIYVHPELRINWQPRDSFGTFLYRLWERGPSFVEYHVFQRRKGPFFLISIAGLLATFGWLILLYFNPSAALVLVLVGLLAVIASTALFAKSFLEFVVLSPLHAGVILAFGGGILKGFFTNLTRAMANPRLFSGMGS